MDTENKVQGLNNDAPTEALTYEKKDSDKGYVEGEHDVMKMKAQRFRDVIANDLLGDFDSKGKYHLSDEIAADLVAVTKKIDSHDQNGTQGRAFVGDRILYFNLTPPKASPENEANAYCYLELLEEIPRINGYYIDTLTTVVATYEYKNDEFFYDRALEVFNFKEYKADEPVDTQLLPESLSARYAFTAAMLKQAETPLENLEEAYFNKRLQLLAEDPELAIILAEFSNKRNKLEPYFAKAENKYQFLNEILDEVLELPACKKALEKSPVREQLIEADKKAYQLVEKVEERVREDNRTKEAVSQAMFTDLAEKPAPKPMPKQVKKGASFELFGKGVPVMKMPPYKGGGGGKKGGAPKPKAPEKPKTMVMPGPLPSQPQQQAGSPFVREVGGFDHSQQQGKGFDMEMGIEK